MDPSPVYPPTLHIYCTHHTKSTPNPHLNMHMKIDEIITMDALVQPTPAQLEDITRGITTPYKNDIYYDQHGADVHIARKTQGKVYGLLLARAYHNPLFDQLPDFIVPENLYSWADDKGVTALNLIKALMKISPLPVVSDVRMTPQAKRFMEKQIDQGSLKARTLNLDTGDITPYDVTIWHQDDDYRVLILDQPFGKPINGPPSQIMEYTWNHAHMLRRLGKL